MNGLRLLLALVGIGSFDPNDKVGPLGSGSQRYLAASQPISYTVMFENVATATAPAKIVTVTDALDTTKFDLSTLNLGPITFGNNTVYPPPGSSWYTEDVNLSPSQNIIVRIAAGLQPGTGDLTFSLTAIDPTTGSIPANPLIGFLPPNITPPQGEGSVLFTIRPVAGLTSGASISNSANIVFDFNPPIGTPTWTNTIDADLPDSWIQPIAPTSTCPIINLQWTGSDVGSGVDEYAIYVSTDGGPLSPWLNTSNQDAVFVGEVGRAYGFACRATDRAGNREPLPGAAETSTLVVGTPASEVTRVGSPPNRNALQPGATSPPVLGATWDPWIDHTNFAPAAVLDLLAVSFLPANLPSALPFATGTLLIDLLAAVPPVHAALPGSTFPLAIPGNCSLLNLQLSTQGAALLPSGSIELTNALDISIGTH